MIGVELRNRHRRQPLAQCPHRYLTGESLVAPRVLREREVSEVHGVHIEVNKQTVEAGFHLRQGLRRGVLWIGEYLLDADSLQSAARNLLTLPLGRLLSAVGE